MKPNLERKKERVQRGALLSADNFSNPRLASSASFPWRRIAWSTFGALPSCSSGLLSRSPHRDGVRISSGSADA